jgi:branched-chain amino acid transport system substrate-binding protein
MLLPFKRRPLVKKNIIALILSICFNLEAQLDIYKDIKSFINTVEEYVTPDELQNLNPASYRNYLKENQPNLFERFLQNLNIKQQEWDASLLKNKLQASTKSRMLQGEKGLFAQNITLKEHDQVIIFGELNGHIHSFYRCLEELKNQKIIDNNLNVAPNAYIIFLGGYSFGQPYTLPTLEIIINLINQNPRNVIPIISNNEYKEQWVNHTLKHELKSHIKINKGIPLRRNINQFFDTLPTIAYVNDKNISAKVYSQDRAKTFNIPINQTDAAIIKFKEKNKGKHKNSSSLIIKPLEKEKLILGKYSLVNKNKILTIEAPPLPTFTNRSLYGLYNDAFIKIMIGKNEWQAYLFEQDSTTQTGFQKKLLTTITSKEPTVATKKEEPKAAIKETVVKKEQPKPIIKKDAPKAPQKKIAPPQEATGVYKIGSIIDLSGSLRLSGKQIQIGTNFILDKINQNGGINKTKIEIKYVDDGYTPKRSRPAAEDLIKQGIDVTLSSSGSPTLQSYLDLVEKKQMAVFFPQTGSDLFRKKDLDIFHLRASYPKEGYTLVKYSKEKLQGKKFLCFLQDDAFGEAGLKGAKKAFEDLKISKDNWIEVRYKRNTTTIESSKIKTAKDFNADTIILISIALAAKEFLKQLGTEFLTNKNILGISDIQEDYFINFLKEQGLKAIIASVTPNPTKSHLKIVEEFRAACKEQNIDPQMFALEAYMNAKVFAHILNQVTGKLTKDKIIEATKKIKSLEFGGLNLNYNPETNELLDMLWLNTGKDEFELVK